MTRLSAERDQGGFILIGRFVEAIRETLIRQDFFLDDVCSSAGGDKSSGQV